MTPRESGSQSCFSGGSPHRFTGKVRHYLDGTSCGTFESGATVRIALHAGSLSGVGFASILVFYLD